MVVLGFYLLAPFSSVTSSASLFFLLLCCWCWCLLFCLFCFLTGSHVVWAGFGLLCSQRQPWRWTFDPPNSTTTIPSSCCIRHWTQSNVPAGQELYQLSCLHSQALLLLISVFIQLLIGSGLTKTLVTIGPTNTYIPQEILYTFWICEP